MRKVASLFSVLGAVVASLALAGSASAVGTVSIVGSNMPGTNTYSLVVSYGTTQPLAGFVFSVYTTGTYTGTYSDPATVGPFGFNLSSGGPVIPSGSGGVAGSWGFLSLSSPQIGPATYTIGTVEITVENGDVVDPWVTGANGFIEPVEFSTLAPDATYSVTIIPEPTTAALLGLGVVGLVAARRSAGRF